jgi:hypothetical protein
VRGGTKPTDPTKELRQSCNHLQQRAHLTNRRAVRVKSLSVHGRIDHTIKSHLPAISPEYVLPSRCRVYRREAPRATTRSGEPSTRCPDPAHRASSQGHQDICNPQAPGASRCQPAFWAVDAKLVKLQGVEPTYGGKIFVRYATRNDVFAEALINSRDRPGLIRWHFKCPKPGSSKRSPVARPRAS